MASSQTAATEPAADPKRDALVADLPALPLAVVGCDYRLASAHWRGRLVLSDAEARQLSRQLSEQDAATGLLELATCNRNEWIVSSWQPSWAAELLRRQMLERLGPDRPAHVVPHVYTGEAAVAHLLRVVLGLEAVVLGERQVASQFFHALERARHREIASRVLNGLGAVAGRALRRADREGLRLADARGVHSLALDLLRPLRPPGRDLRIAVVGMGQIGRLACAQIDGEPGLQALPCNRTVDGVSQVRPLSELPALLAEVDAAIVCTSAPTPVLRPRELAPRAAGQALHLVDLGIPAQIATGRLPAGVVRHDLDDLSRQSQDPHDRKLALAASAELIGRALEQFARYCSEPPFVDILEAVQQQTQALTTDGLGEVVGRHFADLPPELRERLAVDLRSIMQSYSHEVYGAIKQAATRHVAGYKFVDVP